MLGKIDGHVGHFLAGGWLEVFLWALFDEQAARSASGTYTWAWSSGPSTFATATSTTSVSCGNTPSAPWSASRGRWRDPKFDILYKVEATIRQFHLRVRSFIATTSELIYEKSRVNGRILKPQILARAEAYNCRILGIEQIERLARENISADEVGDVFFA